MIQWIISNIWTIIICAVLIGKLRQLQELRYARLMS